MAKIYTNEHNLPDSYYKAVTVDKHRVNGDISVTQLIDAPQIRVLKKQHDETVDVSTMLWALFGTAIHAVLERSEQGSVEVSQLMQAKEIIEDSGSPMAQDISEAIEKLIEEQFPEGINKDMLLEETMTLDVEGYRLSGTCDKFTISSGLLEDYKSCGVYDYIMPESRKKWYAQQNIYAHMLRKKGYTVNKSNIVAIFKNWTKVESLRNKDYPPLAIMSLDVPLLEDSVIESYIKKRIILHKEAMDNGVIPECTGKERWSKAAVFAVMKEGGKRAVRTFDKEHLAKAYIEDNAYKSKAPMSIQYRPGEDIRCDSYCSVSAHCPQLKRRDEMISEKQKELNK
jgi:hypothetical protein